MTRIATTAARAELVPVSVRQLHLLAHVLDPDFEVCLQTPGLVVATSLDAGEYGPSRESYYVRTAHALLALKLVRWHQEGPTRFLVPAPDVAAAIS